MDKPSKREILNEYNALGGRIYDIRYTEEQESKYELISKRITPKESDLVLDIGCGTGLIRSRLKAQYVGLDISSSLISTALTKTRSHPGSELVNGDAENLPFRDLIFDIAYSVTVIQNTPSPIMTVKEMRRVSRKGSWLAITVLKKALSLDALKSLLEQAGLKKISFFNKCDLKDWIAFASS